MLRGEEGTDWQTGSGNEGEGEPEGEERREERKERRKAGGGGRGEKRNFNSSRRY
jgi:hypothetical protein